MVCHIAKPIGAAGSIPMNGVSLNSAEERTRNCQLKI